MHLAPVRSAWCLGQSNTNSGHCIPSRSLTAAEQGSRPAEQPGMRSKSPTLDSGKLGAGRVCLVRGDCPARGGRATPRSTHWGLTRHPIPASLILEPRAGRNPGSARWDSRSGRNYINQEFLTRASSVGAVGQRLRSHPVWRANPEQAQTAGERDPGGVREAQPDRRPVGVSRSRCRPSLKWQRGATLPAVEPRNCEMLQIGRNLGRTVPASCGGYAFWQPGHRV